MPSSDPFAPFAEKLARADQPALLIEVFRRHYERLLAGETGKVSAAEIDAVTDVPDAAGMGRHRDAGLAALDRAVVVKLNGGLGTTMGLTQAKSLLPVKGDLTFLDIIVRQVLHLRAVNRVRLPLILMNSFRTRADSARVLATVSRPGGGRSGGFPAAQGAAHPRRGLEAGVVAAQPEYEWCPPGHGDIYAALQTSGVLATLLDAGIQWAFVSNADNLGAVIDAGHPGLDRDRARAVRDGGVRPVGSRSQGRPSGSSKGRPADAARVQPVPGRRDRVLPGHRALPLLQHQQPVGRSARAGATCSTPRGASSSCRSSSTASRSIPTSHRRPRSCSSRPRWARGSRSSKAPARCTYRATRFVPVKSTSDLLALWSDAYELTDDFRIVVSPRRTAGDLVVDLDRSTSGRSATCGRASPGARPPSCGRGGSWCEATSASREGVVVEGDVEVTQSGAEPLVVPSGRRLAG